MKTCLPKTKKDKSPSGTRPASQVQPYHPSATRFVDNRPEALAQRKLQEVINNSPQALELAQFQAMVNQQAVPLVSNKSDAFNPSVDTPKDKNGLLIQRKLLGGKKGDRVRHDVSGAEFKIVDVKVDGALTLFKLAPKKATSKQCIFVYDDVDTYSFLVTEERWRGKKIFEKSETAMKNFSSGFLIQVDRELLDDKDIGPILQPLLERRPANMEEVESVLAKVRDELNKKDKIFEVGARLTTKRLKIVKGVAGKQVQIGDLRKDPSIESVGKNAGKGLCGNKITHTHPSGQPLSNGDVANAAKYWMKEVRAIGLTVTSISGNPYIEIKGVRDPGYRYSYTDSEYVAGVDSWESSPKMVLGIDLSKDKHMRAWWGAASAAHKFEWTFKDGTKGTEGGRLSPADYAVLVLTKVHNREPLETVQEAVKQANLPALG